MEHLDLDHKMEILEDSSVPITGTVSFPAVQPYHLVAGAPLPTAWPFQDAVPRPCPLAGAQVCLYEYETGSRLVCAKSSPQGTYELPAPKGMNV